MPQVSSIKWECRHLAQGEGGCKLKLALDLLFPWHIIHIQKIITYYSRNEYEDNADHFTDYSLSIILAKNAGY